MNSKANFQNGPEHQITSLVKPQTCGIIWLTNKTLDFNTPGVYEINYLLNGLLIQSLESGLSHPEKNLYLSENFGNPFFIAHVKTDNKKELDSIYNHLKMVKDQITHNSEVLFISEKNHSEISNTFEKVKNEFKQFQFHLKTLTES